MIVLHARRLTVLGALIVTAAAGVGVARSEPAPDHRALVSALLRLEAPQPRPPVAVEFLDDDVLAEENPTPAPVGPELPLLTTSAAEREPTDLRLLIADGERWRLMEFGAAATWRPLAAKVTASGQLPYVVSERLDGGLALDEALDQTQEPAALGVNGRVGDLEAGAQYRSVGKRLERIVSAPAALKDREGHELWIAQRLGMLRLRLSDSELTDNVDRNPALPRTTKDQSAATVELLVHDWPVLGLTYASGDSARVRLTPQGREGSPERREFESVTGSAYYHGGPGWEVATSSTVSLSRHATRPGDEMTALYQDLSLTLHLIEAVTLVPTLGVGVERYAPADFGSDTGTAGLTLSYAPRPGRWWASTSVGYTAIRTSDGSTDARNVSLTGALTCALGRLLPAQSTLSFEAAYDRYVDAVVPDSASRAVSGFVLLRFAGF
ncbi:MAG TPA: hypothetical protein VF136_00260 [Methylomirabilota bacterium]